MEMNTLNEQRALQAWKDGMGDAMAAVKLLRDRTGLSLREASALIQKIAAQVGGQFSLHLYTEGELPPELDEWKEYSTRIAEHRAARGVRKIRGAK